ncbi:MAG: MFS transporter [Synechococcus sp. ELA057]
MRQVLAIAPFRNFWLANLFSNLGTNAYLMALSWFTVRQYGAVGIGALALGYGLPQLLLQLIGGSASDRMRRRSLFFCTETGMLLLSLVLLIASLRGIVPLWLLVVVSAGNGSISAFDSSARTGLISGMVPQRLVVDAQQIYGLAASITTVIGPALGGVLLSLGPDMKSHEEYAFLFNTLSFLPLLVCVPFLPCSGAATGAARQGLWNSVREGLRFVRHQRSVRTLLQLLAVVMLLGMPFQTLLPIFVHSHLSLQTGHAFYAALLSAVGLGAFAGSLLGVQLGEKRQPGPALFLAALGLGFAILLMCSGRVLHWTSLSVFLAGACGALVVNLDNALVEGLTPMELQGRVSSIASLSKSFQTISAAAASGLIHLFSRVNASSGFLEVQVPLALLLIVGTLILRPGVWCLSQPAEPASASA